MNKMKAVVEEITEESILLLVGEEEEVLILVKEEIMYPENLVSGDWVDIETDGEQVLSIRVDTTETERVKKRIQEKMNRLRKRSEDNRDGESL